MNGVKISGVGKAVPKYVMTNDQLAEFVDTSDEWIRTRTGIGARHISKGETTTQLAIEAGKEALLNSGVDVEDIDLIIVATITPDYVMPSTACMVQEALGACNATAFDITAACSGFIYGSKLATESITLGNSKHALVIGVEVLSKAVNWEDRTTCVLFGDGAGAAIFSSHHKNNIIGIHTGSNGGGGKALTLPGRPLSNCFINAEDKKEYMYMDGQDVYRFATTTVPISIQSVLEDTDYRLDDIDCFILHQANARIMDSVANKLKVPKEKFFKNLDTYGNTSAASIPMALYDVVPTLKSGDKVILSGFGGGLTWGSMLLLWD